MRINEIASTSTVDEEWYNPLTWFKKKPRSTTKVEPVVKPEVKTVSPNLIPGDGLANQAAHHIAKNKNKKAKALADLKKELGEDDVESDIYAQDTMKNPGPEIIRLAFNDDLDHLERVMDNVTSDDYMNRTGDDYFWNKHAKIISDNVPGDWKWEDVIAFWDLEDIDKAIWIYQNNFQDKVTSEAELNEFTISDLKYMGITHITSEQKKELQKISHENGGNITRSDLKKVGLLLQTRHVREDGVIVPGVNTTVDVKPGQTEIEAAKFGNGKIKPLMPKARKNSTAHNLYNMGLAEGDPEADKKNPHAQPYLDTQEWKDLHFMGDEIIDAYIKHKQKGRLVGQAIGRAIANEGDIEADKRNPIAIPHLDNPWWKKLHDMDDKIISAYVKHKSLKRAVGRGIKKGLKKLSRLGSKNVSSKFDGKGHVSTTTRYNEDEEMVTLRKGDKEVKVPRSRVSHFIDRHYRIVEGSRPHLLYTLLEADKDGDGKGDLKGFDAKTQYALKALQAKYPHADNLMSALMAQTSKTLDMQKISDNQQDENDSKHNHRFQELEKKLINVIKKNKLTEDIKDREQIIKDYIKVFK